MEGRLSSRDREKQIVRWLDAIAEDAAEIYLLGDVFDFWFEYKNVVPKGFVRLLGKLAELRDRGIPIYFFTGNHDMWMFSYFEEELNIPTYRRSIRRTLMGKEFLIGHGDGLGPEDRGYKFIKKVFAHPWSQWLFARLHPHLGIGLANFWSGKSRTSNPEVEHWLGTESEWLVAYSERKLEQHPEMDYFIFGHRHLPIDHTLKNGRSRYINLGDWIHFNSYAVFDGRDVQLKFYENPDGKIYGNT